VKRLTLVYLASYLLVGGLGLVVAPDLTLRLLGSNGAYGDIMPRFAGSFMVVLGAMIGRFARARDFRYYGTTILGRSFIVLVLAVLFFKTRDPLFLVLTAIVLVGLVPSIYAATRGDDGA
jgi:hypothetical protein